jgi:23S rRNA (adenine2503-C2)-methyltransferase
MPSFAEKKAFEFAGGAVEACGLYLPYRSVPSVICISSQIGCPYSCKICANGRAPFKRNLSVAEMISQTKFFLEKYFPLHKEKFDITLMGVGEPLENIENVLRFIELAFLKWPYLNKVNISTVGLIGGINKLVSSNFKDKVHLQISLHAPFDEKRRDLLDKKLDSIEGLIKAADNFAERMNDKICYNYVMIKNMNDTLNDMLVLVSLLKNKKVYVKLSKLNFIDNMIFEPSEEEKVKKAKLVLEKHGVEVKLFNSIGSEKCIGCGQLAANIKSSVIDKLVYAQSEFELVTIK